MSAHQATPPMTDRAVTLRLLEHSVNHLYRTTHVPGFVVGATWGDGARWQAAVGHADVEAGRAATPGTRYRIGSISKTFIALALLQLARAGKLHLTDPVARHLPWFTLQHPQGTPPTLYHVLTHTAGLPRDGTVPHWTENDFQPWDAVVHTTPTRTLSAPPLARFDYSNLGYALLGAVVQAASGHSWDVYVRQHILDPLGLHDTHTIPRPDDHQQALGYFARKGGQLRRAPFTDMRGFAAAGNLTSTLGDMLAYAAAHLTDADTALIDALALRDMHRPHWVHDDWSGGYGLGMEVYHADGHTLTGHGGGLKGYVAQIMFARAARTAVVVLSNSPDTDARVLAKTVLKALAQAPDAPPPPKAPAFDATPYVGIYGNDWYESAVFVRDGKLHTVPLRDVTAPTVLLPVDGQPHHFRPASADAYAAPSRFTLDATGRADRLWTGYDYSTRVGDL